MATSLSPPPHLSLSLSRSLALCLSVSPRLPLCQCQLINNAFIRKLYTTTVTLSFCARDECLWEFENWLPKNEKRNFHSSRQRCGGGAGVDTNFLFFCFFLEHFVARMRPQRTSSMASCTHECALLCVQGILYSRYASSQLIIIWLSALSNWHSRIKPNLTKPKRNDFLFVFDSNRLNGVSGLMLYTLSSDGLAKDQRLIFQIRVCCVHLCDFSLCAHRCEFSKTHCKRRIFTVSTKWNEKWKGWRRGKK